MIKKALIVLLCVALATITTINIYAATIVQVEDYILKIEDDNSTALDGWESEGVLVVPNSVNNYYISSISDYAFMNNTDITGVDFSNAYTLKKIGYLSFANCKNISGNITIPSRITTIGTGSFQECSSVMSVDLYSGSSSIPAQMFYDCDSLTEVNVNYGFTSIGKLAFANCESLEDVYLSWTISDIHDTAFYGCDSLTIHCYTNSYAHQYAEEKGIEYVLIDAPEPPPETEPPTETPETEPPTQEPETDLPTEAPETQQPTAVPETEVPTQEPETQAPETQPAQGYYLGDMDANGAVESLDVTYILRYLAAYADVDGDGVLTILDATLIQRYLAEMTVAYPIGEWVAV